MRIDRMTIATLPLAKVLVDRVFPVQSPAERLFFWAHARRHTIFVRSVLKLVGVEDLGDFWVALTTTRLSSAPSAFIGIEKTRVRPSGFPGSVCLLSLVARV